MTDAAGEPPRPAPPAGGSGTADGHPTVGRSGRELAVAVVGHLAGGGLALLAARHDWAVSVVPRPAPLPALRHTYPGADLAVWLPAGALVGIAAGVALYATRGWGRRLVALVAALCGAATVVGGGYGLAVAGEDGRTVLDAGTWPVLTIAGGLLLLAAAALTLVHGSRWPSMGSRYQRAQPPPSGAAVPPEAGPDAAARLWDALDAGTDPTQRP